jgi:hypothetical protein
MVTDDLKLLIATENLYEFSCHLKSYELKLNYHG